MPSCGAASSRPPTAGRSTARPMRPTQPRGAARAGLVGSRVEGDALLRRGVVEASYRWALDGPPDADDEAAADWTPPSLEDDGDGRPARRPQRANRGGPG